MQKTAIINTMDKTGQFGIKLVATSHLSNERT